MQMCVFCGRCVFARALHCACVRICGGVIVFVLCVCVCVCVCACVRVRACARGVINARNCLRFADWEKRLGFVVVFL